MELISRKEAKLKGLKKYFNGEPCTNGHVCERYVCDCRCCGCKSKDYQLYKRRHPERVKTQQSNWYKDNRSYMTFRLMPNDQVELAKNTHKPEICPLCLHKHKKIVCDHDHTTGKFRGWICDPCNRSIGNSKDNPETLERQAEYLRKSK